MADYNFILISSRTLPFFMKKKKTEISTAHREANLIHITKKTMQFLKFSTNGDVSEIKGRVAHFVFSAMEITDQVAMK